MTEARTLVLAIEVEVSVHGTSEFLATDRLAIIAKHPHLVDATDALSNMITDVVFDAIAKLRERDDG